MKSPSRPKNKESMPLRIPWESPEVSTECHPGISMCPERVWRRMLLIKTMLEDLALKLCEQEQWYT